MCIYHVCHLIRNKKYNTEHWVIILLQIQQQYTSNKYIQQNVSRYPHWAQTVVGFRQDHPHITQQIQMDWTGLKQAS